MPREIVHTDNAPQAIGAYSQGVRCGGTLYVSGQIPLDPETQQLVSGDVKTHIRRVFENIAAVAEAGGATLAQTAKLNVYLTDMDDFSAVSEVMDEYFVEPYPARAAVGVAMLPKGARLEADAVLVLD